MPQLKKDSHQLNNFQAKIQAYQNKLEADQAVYGKEFQPLELKNVKILNQALQRLAQIITLNDLTPELQKEENQLVQDSRVAMRELMNNESKSNLSKDFVTRDFFNFIFQIQILFATYWPLNKPNEEGGYDDPLLLTALEYGNDVVVSSTGYWFDKVGLNNYFRRNNAFVVNNDVVSVRGPMDQEKLNEREINYLKQNGINIPRPDLQLLAVNRALGLGGELIDPNDPAAQAQQQRVVSRYNISRGALRGWTLGIMVGGIIGFVGTLALMAFAPPLPLAGLGIFWATSILSGVIANKPQRATFSRGFTFSIIGNLLLMGATALLAPQILLGLTSLSIISSTAAASVIANLPFIFSAIPPLSFLAGALAEAITPGGLTNMFFNIIMAPVIVSVYTFGAIGKYSGLAISKISNLINPPMPVPAHHHFAIENNPLLAENDQEFHPNQRGIMNGLGVDPQNRLNGQEPEAKQEVDTNIIQDQEEQDLSKAIEESLVIRPSISR